MNTFEYTAAFVSILFGLAVGDLMVSLHRLLRAGRRVRWDALAVAAALLAGLTVLNAWWAMFGWLRRHETLTLVGFLPQLLSLLLLFLLVSAALPDEVPAEGVDLRVYYDKNRRYFWSLLGLYLTLVTVLMLASGRPLPPFLTAQNVTCVALMGALVLTGRRWLHWLVVALLFAMLSSILVRQTLRPPAAPPPATVSTTPPPAR